MDIWAWVHEKEEQLYDAGEYRLANIITSMPRHCCDDEHDIVDALYAEGLPLAQKAKEPWAEVFIRHWYLQSQVLTRNNAKGMLSEAIELLELSHSEEAKGCPQRICAVQDLANCYGKADGPGFADERIAVSTETLAEIDPSWPCYTCIGAEYIDALVDDQRYDEALREGDRLQSELVKYKGKASDTIDEVLNSQAHALIRLARYDEAISLLRSKPISSVDGSGGKKNKILQCLAMAYSGEFDQINEHMVPLVEVLKSHTYFNTWAEIQAKLIAAKQIAFDDETANIFRDMAHKLIDNGSHRCAFNQLLILADLALRNEYLFTANLALEKIQTVIPSLNKDCGAEADFNEVKTLYLSTLEKANIKLFSHTKALFDFEFLSNDDYAQSLEVFHQNHPSNVEVASALAELYSNYGHKEKGLTLIKYVYQNHTTDPDANFAYGRFLLNEYGRDALIEAFGQLLSGDISEDPIQGNILWLFAHAHKGSAPEKAISYFETYLKANPQHLGALRNLAWLSCKIEAYPRSIELWNMVIELDPDNLDHHWDKLIPATLANDWSNIRNACDVIGLKLEGDSGPIHQKMGGCRIRFSDDLGSGEIFYAHRTGPVTATVKGISQLDEDQRFGQELVFNPAPLNQLDQKDDDGDACDSEGFYSHLYEAYRITKSAPYVCYAIDGVHPGKENVDELIRELNENDFVFDQRNNDNYVLEFHDESGQEQESAGIYAYVLIPTSADRSSLHDIFSRFSIAQKHPLIWPKLLEELTLTDVLKEQSIIEERYGL